MSNILDAIRKAEADRHDDGVPSLEAIVQQKRSGKGKVRQQRSSGWIWLALLLVFASAGYLYKEPILKQGKSLQRQLQGKVAVLVEKLGAGNLVSRSYPTQPVLKRNAQVPPSPSGVDDSRGVLTDRQRQLLNALRFDVVSYSRDKLKRFVMIGSRTYREGDQLEGFTIRAIQAEGVVLNINGQNVLIRP